MSSLYDKLDDFLLLGAAGDPDKLFIQQTNGTFSFKPNPSFTKDAGFESTCGALQSYLLKNNNENWIDIAPLRSEISVW